MPGATGPSALPRSSSGGAPSPLDPSHPARRWPSRSPTRCPVPPPCSEPWPRACGWPRSIPATPEEGPSGLETVLARTGAQAVLADRARHRGLPPGLDRVRRRWRPPAATSGHGSAVGRPGRHRALLVRHDRAAQGGASCAVRLLHTARCVVAHHDLTAEDRCFNSLPLFHINAEVVALLSSLVAGSCLVLDDRFHRTGFWELIGAAAGHVDQRRARHHFPAGRSADASETVPAGVRFIRSASAPLPVGDGGPLRRAHRHPRRRDLWHDRGRQPDHRPPLVGASPRRLRRRAGRDRAPDRRRGRPPRRRRRSAVRRKWARSRFAARR